MDSLIKDYVRIAIELIVFVVLLGFIVYVAGVSQNLLSIGQDRKAFNTELGIQRELSQFNNRPMTGDDVIVAVKKYTKLYDMRIEQGSEGSNTFFILSKTSSEITWGEDNIRLQMGSDIQKAYTSKIIRTPDGEVSAIQFNRDDTP